MKTQDTINLAGKESKTSKLASGPGNSMFIKSAFYETCSILKATGSSYYFDGIQFFWTTR